MAFSSPEGSWEDDYLVFYFLFSTQFSFGPKKFLNKHKGLINMKKSKKMPFRCLEEVSRSASHHSF